MRCLRSIIFACFSLVLCLAVSGCRGAETNGNNAETSNGQRANRSSASQNTNASTFAATPTYTYEVVNIWPHDPTAFTQGLIFHEGFLLESTGQYGESSLRKVELKTGKVSKRISVPGQFFAEGLTLLRGKLFQLTWTERKGFIYDPDTLQLQDSFSYGGEGWGLTDDGDSLIMSDGTHQLRFIDPLTFQVEKTVDVFDEGQPLRELNELEFVDGEIFANIWHRDEIVRLDPQSGKILGRIDLKGLLPLDGRQRNPEAVLNGIAFDEVGKRLFVTGKLWPSVFEIKIKERKTGT